MDRGTIRAVFNVCRHRGTRLRNQTDGHFADRIQCPVSLTGNFNSHLRDCIALFADEAFWAGDRAGESVLKMLVTEPVIPIEGKGRDLVLVPNRYESSSRVIRSGLSPPAWMNGGSAFSTSTRRTNRTILRRGRNRDQRRSGVEAWCACFARPEPSRLHSPVKTQASAWYAGAPAARRRRAPVRLTGIQRPSVRGITESRRLHRTRPSI